MLSYKTGSKVLYVARAQKRSERNEILRRQFEERRKERILKYKVEFVAVAFSLASLVCHFSFTYDCFFFIF